MTGKDMDGQLVKVSPLRRWGPFALVIGVVVAVVVALQIGGNDDETPDTGEEVVDGSTNSELTDNPLLPVLYPDSERDGTVDDYDWGERCDTSTGRTEIDSVYAPPCVPVWGGAEPWRNQGGEVVDNNGGATAEGVTDDTITVVYYTPGPTDLFSLAQSLGVIDDYDTMEQTLREFVDAANDVYETYGRNVEIVRFQGTGDGKDPTAARADAIKVATEEGAFASIGGPTQTTAYQDTLAEHGVLCISCSPATTIERYQENAPYNWGTNPTPEQSLVAALEFAKENLAGSPAQFAGTPELAEQERVFGVVHYEQDPPIYGAIRDDVLTSFAEQGFETAVDLTYLLDTSTLATQAQTIIGQLKEAGVTTVIHVGDPIAPINLTEEATRQEYYPEWMISGTIFTDSTATGRLTDQTQWKNAFGISSLAARMPPEESVGWRFYEWYYGTAPASQRSVPLVYPPVQTLFSGIQLAGPSLSAETFAGGLFNLPAAGGDVTAPQMSFGTIDDDGNVDYVAIDDYTVVWWAADVEGPTEQGAEGLGMWAYVDGGKRYPRGEAPSLGDDVLFDPEGAVTIYEKPPGDRPVVPAWPGSPAAG